ncbi:RT_RNaseH_2 domain-containing protein [Trichonephila clavata]|uniref:RT_RNaseH_2 domain-containing protein n=1 Tax=Trichonephila clavata TaxID=2740835 RepID=A0A8X6HZU9_TRICU|nr:RT_RNaseH_2 domain-containing protein [Trichonephila clavata]
MFLNGASVTFSCSFVTKATTVIEICSEKNRTSHRKKNALLSEISHEPVRIEVSPSNKDSEEIDSSSELPVLEGEREIPSGAARSVEEYLKQLQKKLQDAHEIASENSAKNQERMTAHYNLRSRGKSFSVGDEVLILMPSSTHKLLNTWLGPAKVVKLTRPYSCVVQMEDGCTRELRVNKLRPYISRVDHVGIIFDQDTDFGELHYAPTDKENQSNIDIELNQIPDISNA